MRVYKKISLMVLCISLLMSAGVGLSFGQIKKSKPQSFVIRGKVKNFTDPSWNFLLTGFLKNEGLSMPVAADGSFTKTINAADPTDLYLYLNDDAIVIFASPGDTLTLAWDNKDFKNTFKIKVNTVSGQEEMDLMMDLYAKYWPTMREIEKGLRSAGTPDSVKFNKINAMFTGQVNLILQYPVTANSDKILYDTYARDKYVLHSLNELTHKNYSLELEKAIPDTALEKYNLHMFSLIDETLNEKLFLKSYEYQEYVDNQVGDRNPFTSFDWKDNRTELRSNYTMDNCYKGMGYLSESPMIRDWFIAKTIVGDFYEYQFDKVEQAYLKFLPEMKTPKFKDALIAYHTQMRALKPGNPAPIFKLKDVSGKLVSLKDFRGKVVYLDFWSVDCAPCIYDIKTYSAKFHEKYKNQGVVFLNVCVEPSNATWKKKMAELHMEGVNLSANFISEPACKAYHINGVPHYIIVDAKGDIVNSNADRMGDLLGASGISIKKDRKGNNELDMAIAKR